MKNALEFDLHQFASINQRLPLTQNACEYHVLLEFVGMLVYLYNIVGFQCIASCYTESTAQLLCGRKRFAIKYKWLSIVDGCLVC